MKFSLSQIEHEIIYLMKGFVNTDQSFYEKSNEFWGLILLFIFLCFFLRTQDMCMFWIVQSAVPKILCI